MSPQYSFHHSKPSLKKAIVGISETTFLSTLYFPNALFVYFYLILIVSDLIIYALIPSSDISLPTVVFTKYVVFKCLII